MVDEVARSGRPAIVSKHGAPVEDIVLARAPEYLADMGAAEIDLAASRTRSAADVFGELDAADDA